MKRAEYDEVLGFGQQLAAMGVAMTEGRTEKIEVPKPVTIYFIGPANGPIKIGFAKRLSFRLRELQLANSYPLGVLASVEGPMLLEREYHHKFAAHRLHGEWFSRAPAILAEIERLNGGASSQRGVGL